LPPAQVEYVEKQPSLEDIFLAITGSDGTGSNHSGLATPARTTKEQR
jgi:ABC-2 type transport system ATP-binding protein